MMNKFQRILLVVSNDEVSDEVVKQALSLSRNNQASVKILIVYSAFPDNISDYQNAYEQSLGEQIQAKIAQLAPMLKMNPSELDLDIRIVNSNMPAITIIRFVLREGCDLLIKAPETKDQPGFKAVDMELLRKCPVPVWLQREVLHPRDKIKIAVAIDPEDKGQVVTDLSVRMLQLARHMADGFSKELTIISCWQYRYEEYLRHNTWAKLPEEKVQQVVNESQVLNRQALDRLISDSKISGNQAVEHIRGFADEIIPQFVLDNEIDILIMGTLARTGIQGFIIGNTAENISQKLSCSLLALKPYGFVSPIKAY